MPPRPRPRPKPKLRSGNNSQSLEGVPPTQDEEDSIFIKSSNLTTATWKRMNKMPSAHEPREDSINYGDQHKAAKKVGGKELIPKLVKSQSDHGGTQSLYIDNSDDELIPLVNSKRPRSRSRSITPPPELAPEQRMRARNLVRQALGVSDRRSISPQSTRFDCHKMHDMEAFDPELESIVLRSTKTNSSFPSGVAKDDNPHRIIINVQWRFHPSEGGQKPPRWTFHVNRSDNLRHVFGEVADAMGVLPDDIVLTLKGHRVYSSVSPAALGIWLDEEFDAHFRETYQLLKDSRSLIPSGSTTTPTEGEDSEGRSSDTTSVGDTSEDAFKLTLRSVKTPKGIVLIVRPHTKCGKIVEAYLKKAGLANEYLKHDTTTRVQLRGRHGILAPSGPQLVVDGDRLDSEVEIREADVENGDIVEVTGL